MRYLQLFCLLLLTACGVNPVTGKQEFAIVSEAREQEIGRQNYAIMRQMGGGDQTNDPELSTYVRGVGRKLASVSDRNHLGYEFYILNDSVPNAWALPGGKIAINRGLLVNLNSEAELAAVLGHEIVHAAARHGAKAMERAILLQTGVIALGASVGSGVYQDVIMRSGGIAASLVQMKHSRSAELEADYYGMQYMSQAGYDPNAAVALQEMFVRLSNQRSSGWSGGLFASHPPSTERVSANKKTVQELPEGGYLGEESYQRAIQKLKRAEKAYQNLDEATELVEKQRSLDQALALMQEAIRIEPSEAKFYGLRGRIRWLDGDQSLAEEDYGTAIRLNRSYFAYHLQRGQLLFETGRFSEAKSDLKESLELLPTAQGHYYLGRIAESQGRPGIAIEHYRTASIADSDLGQDARRRLKALGG